MDKKIIESIILSDYEILTNDGFKDVKALHKTIKYVIYKLVLDNLELHCADNHIVFLEDDTEIFVKNLIPGQFIKTKYGINEVLFIEKTALSEHMYDFELSGDNFKYYTNDILSHNTNYIKYLIANTECPILYIPPHMANTLADPSFITFIMNYENCVLVIEDAENAIQARTGEYTSPAVSNLLNMSDGILGAALKLKIIATFNSPKSSIDEALLRPGRLIAEHYFDKLGVDEANTLLGHLNKDHVATEDMTLAEIYNVDNMPAGIVKKNSKIGF